MDNINTNINKNKRQIFQNHKSNLEIKQEEFLLY